MSKKDNSEEIAKGVGALIVLGFILAAAATVFSAALLVAGIGASYGALRAISNYYSAMCAHISFLKPGKAGPKP